jgi:transposase-like protein
MATYSFKQFRAEFPDDDACLEKIVEIRFGGHEFICPGCERMSRFSRVTGRRSYACQWCGHHVYPCAGTPFEKSRTPLSDWFFAMYLMTSTRHGVAARELQRQIGCTYKTAWRMSHELRKLMAQSDDLLLPD